MDVRNISKYASPYDHDETVVLSLTLAVIIVFSLIGNLVIVLTLYKNNKLWISTNILIGNLSLSSLGVTILVMPFSLFTTTSKKWIFKEGIVCNLTGFSASLLLLVTIFTHTAISIDKYYGVVKPLSRAFTAKRTWIMVAVIWAVSSAMSLGPLVGIARFEYNPTTLICGVGFPKSFSEYVYLGLLSALGFMVPTNIMLFVYLRVFVAVRQQARRLIAHAIVNHEVLQLQKRLILTVFLSWMCFIACWAPFFFLTILAVLIKDRSQLPHALGVAAYWTGYSNSVMYPFIICSMSRRFRDGFLDMLKYLVKAPFAIISICRRSGLKEDKSENGQKAIVIINDISKKGSDKSIPKMPLSPVILSSSA